MSALGSLPGTILLLVELVLLARVVLDRVGVLAPNGGGVVVRARMLTHRLTEPLIAPVRRVVPPLRVGGVGIDLAFTLVLVAVIVLRSLVVRV